MLKITCLLWLGLTIPAATQDLVECSYNLPRSGQRIFVQQAIEAATWLDWMRRDKSIPDWDSKSECHPLDDVAADWHLFTQTENGTVSLQHGLTRRICEMTLAKLRPTWCNGCVGTVQSSDLKKGECFK